MKIGLWLLSTAAIGAVSTLLAASLPVPPSLPSTATRHPPTLVAAAPAPSVPAEPTTPPAPPPAPPAAPPLRAAVAPPAPIIAQPKRVVAAAIAPNQKAQRPARHLAKATPDRHRRVVVHVVPQPPVPYPGMPVRPPTRIAMGPPPYGMPAPYWRMPYPPDY
jgi:hypothetical protein